MNGLSVILPVKPPEPYLPVLMEEIHFFLRNINHEIFVQTEVGLTNAVIKGVEKSNYDTIVVMDSDGSHNPFYFIPMQACIGVGKNDLIVGSKALGKDETSRGRRIISGLYRWFARTLLSLSIKDPMSGFVMGKKSVFLNLKPSMDYKFLLQLLTYNPPPNVVEIPILFKKRKRGKSKATLKTGLKTFFTIIKYWWE